MARFNERLKELRTKRKMSQQELADRLDISKSSINMYERGEREPGLEMLETIADFFNVDMDYLHGKSNIANRALESPGQYCKTGWEETEESPIALSASEKKLIDNYRSLNEEGQQIAFNLVDGLVKTENYKKSAPNGLGQKKA